MLKPLIPSIPSKELLIEGKYYRVYDIVNLENPKRLHSPYAYTCLFVCINASRARKTVRVFPGIKDPAEKTKAIHLYIEGIVDHLNDFVEQNYFGDRLRYSDLKEKYNLSKKHGWAHCYTYVEYLHHTEPGVKQTKICKNVGRTDQITQVDIDMFVNDVVTHQLTMNKRYNELLAAKHKAFREQVEKEIAERNQQLQLQEI